MQKKAPREIYERLNLRFKYSTRAFYREISCKLSKGKKNTLISELLREAKHRFVYYGINFSDIQVFLTAYLAKRPHFRHDVHVWVHLIAILH